MSREGYKMTELGEIPQDWEVNSLEDICINRGLVRGPFGGALKKEYFVETGFKVYEQRNAIYKSAELGNYFIDADKYKELERFKINCGDFIVSCSGTIGKIYKIPSYAPKGVINQALLKITVNKNKVVDDYFYHYFEWESFQKRIVDNTQGGVMKNLVGMDIIKQTAFPIPPLSEQQKVADILSTVDRQIEQTDALIEKTMELKKGLMQRLLTKGIGHTEFRDTEIGKIPVEWEVKQLGDVSRGKGEYGIGASATEYIDGNARYLRITDIGDDSKLLNSDVKGLKENNYIDYLLKENDIVFARTGNTTGKSYLYDKSHGELVFAGFLIRFKIDSSIMDSRLVKYFVQSKKYWNWVKVMSTRSGQPGINSNEYSTLKIPVPPITEQIKISDILSAVDEDIARSEDKADKLKKVKKALMQQLLTGKIRVIV